MAKLSEAERKVAEWIWANPNITSAKLVEACTASYGWKSSTVFTLLKRMKDKGLLVQEEYKLKMALARDAYYYGFAREIVDTYYNGSFVRFFESYCGKHGISKNEAGRLIYCIRENTK